MRTLLSAAALSLVACTAMAQPTGPVTTKSTQLQGVDDFHVLTADHNSLYYPVDNAKAPAAWPLIKDRLQR